MALALFAGCAPAPRALAPQSVTAKDTHSSPFAHEESAAVAASPNEMEVPVGGAARAELSKREVNPADPAPPAPAPRREEAKRASRVPVVGAAPKPLASTTPNAPSSSAPTAPIPSAASEYNTEAYAAIQENSFQSAKERPLSTFSVDVDTASYSNARRFLAEGSLPPRDSIRVEEWVNYFGYSYAAPTGPQPFAVHTEVTDCPWDAQHRLVRIGIQGRDVPETQIPPRNLVFLVDVSGSMMSSDKLPLVQRALALLTSSLRPQDSIAIAVYAGSSGLALPPTSGRDRSKILRALEQLNAGGSTNGGEGIRLAYNVAREHFEAGGINRVILATDGDFNVGTTSEGELTRLIEEQRKTGIFLTVLGFGSGNLKDATMEMLADKGNGNYAYIDSLAEARKVLVREAGATLVTIAKDVKLQVEFNPARVAQYRLIGYENRALADRDFNDDSKDAGEIGAGHSVTALYEIVPFAAASRPVPGVDPLKYQTTTALSPAARGDELMTVNIRYKEPNADKSLKLTRTVTDSNTPLARTHVDTRFSIAVAEAALLLRRGTLGSGSLKQVRELADQARGPDPHGDRREFVAMLDAAMKVQRGVPAAQVAR
ncbi:MAG TPA: VWA domain-containing protein [Polyangiaceae bacterium]|nr:VWA domain-containing protein [Polyangiaceae bacterium]